ncbi:Hsp70 family protein [Lentzea sp. HUAS12]|uniref:Hsp70 family protein n=1 Tax=Lentzea sp. HUAS12 TaxID=2951806 RepID=UPI00209DB966|nr:Hsp70 family protein [Lentzea sp. HUAS12]USX55501.1 Hsp70 family protein [Lentzea sp. HUAS12]
MSYGLGVDIGTTYTAAAVSDASGTRAIPLGRDVVVSSVVFATEGGELITGDAADGESRKQPLRASHSHKRRLADPTPLKICDVVRSPALLMAAQLRDAISLATAMRGRPPASVVLTCPAVWGPYRREHFSEVPRLAGVKDAVIVTEPEAAAMHHSVERRLGEGEIVGVYDLGGGTFDATVLQARRHGMEILGTPEGVERLGGIDFDDSLLALVDQRVDGEITRLDPADAEQARILLSVREVCRRAKEELSAATDTLLHLDLPDGSREVTVTRADFERAIAPQLALTTDAFRRTISSAGLRADDLASVLLVGGSSQIPLVADTLSKTVGKPLRAGLHPKLSVALGAAALARNALQRSPAVPAAARRSAAPAHAVPGRPAGPPVPAGVPTAGMPVHTNPPTPSGPSAHAGPPLPGIRPAASVDELPVRRRNFTAAQPTRSMRRRNTAVIATAAVTVLAAGAITAAVVLTSGGDSAETPAPAAANGTSAPPASSGPLFLHDGRDVAPFHSMVGSEANWAGTALTADGKASQQAVAVRPADVNGSKDGRQVTWTGKGAAQFYVQNPQGRLDATPYVESGTLTFDVVVVKAPTAEVSLAAHCGYPCAAQLNATKPLQRLPIGQKTTMRIPLRCFAGKGLDTAAVDVPFLVHTTGTFEVKFAEVRWEPTGTTGSGPVTSCADLS